MSGDYVEPRSGRHRIELIDGVEQIGIAPERRWVVIPFLPRWRAMRSFGGAAIALSIARAGS